MQRSPLEILVLVVYLVVGLVAVACGVSWLAEARQHPVTTVTMSDPGQRQGRLEIPDTAHPPTPVPVTTITPGWINTLKPAAAYCIDRGNGFYATYNGGPLGGQVVK